MLRIPTNSRALFASGLLSLSLVGFYFGDFASVLQEFPRWIPASSAIIYTAAVLMLLGGVGLLFERTAALSARILFYYLAVWVVLLNVPIVLRAPQIEVNWQGMSEILVLLAGGWVLHASLAAPPDGSPSTFVTGERGIRRAQLLFGFALLPLGLAHFFYLSNTAPLVPAWLPYHTAWAYLTGAAQMAAGVAVLLSIVPRLAAVLDTLLLSAFTFLVWIPLIVAKPSAKELWSEFTISWAITTGAWVVAQSIPQRKNARP